MEVMQFKSSEERLRYLKGGFEEIHPQKVDEAPKEEKKPSKKGAKKSTKKGAKKDEVQAE